ncbi:MAG: tryptophan-rich sensory protein [Clostridia bacterium]|nr:tryptophan-rich sensory protein [Clostridia bacterium]
MWNKIKPYVISIAIALGVGALSSLLTKGNMNLYDYIVKPPLSPPMIVFPIVWSILFILMGISSAMVFVNRENNKEAARSALLTYAFQLAVNFFWSIIFFNMKAYLFAFIWILLLLALILIMIIQFRKVSKTAAYLQIPYLLWVIFAAYLTFMVYFLNR